MGGADWPPVQDNRRRIAITLSRRVRPAKQTTPETH
jgi:hypothetical protein